MSGGEHQFDRVQVLKDEDSELGVGSYGAVYKAKCDDLLCAAKVLHRALFQTNDPGSRDVLSRFRQECRFLSQIRHPHIVQYLGIWRDPEFQLPVLLMELLDESLTMYLERSKLPLPYHVEINIAHDVALALAFLHSKDIVHRDLSSNNVLLIAGQRAKVTDFGMSKLIDARSRRRTLTHCPGTEVYMPPEALKEPPSYTKKIDCFSFGPLAIQIMTRQFPNPGARTRQVDDPQSPTGTAERPVLEEERRRAHISLIDRNHALLPIVMQCLKYNHSHRPTSAQLCMRISELKQEQCYKESGSLSTQQPGSQSFQFNWSESVQAPCEMASGSATAIGEVVYVQPWGSSKVYSFDFGDKRWAELADCQKRECSLVTVKGRVTAVGGCTDTEDFDTLTSLEMRSRGRSRWVVKLKNMPTKRYSTAAVSNEEVLIVTGGFSNERPLSSVEIMDIESEQWYIASKLPRALHRHSATLCGNLVYMLGGKDSSGSTTSVFQSSLSVLLLRASPALQESGTNVDVQASVAMDSPWKSVSPIPLNFTTSLSIQNASSGSKKLVAFGGYNSERKQRSSDVHVYDPTHDSWLQIGAMISPRSSCISSVLSNNRVFVIGGKNRLGLLSDTVEIGLFC
jgi:serine/threonine protein kinase